MSKTAYKILLGIVIFLGIFFFGFYFGRKTVNTKEKVIIEYVKGDTISDTITNIIPKKEYIPADTLKIIQQCIKDGKYSDLFPTKIIDKYIKFTSEDTLAILKDWATKREYEQTLFDSDTCGTMKVNAEIQYNKMNSLNYTFTPVIKTVTKTVYKTKLLSPYVGANILFNTTSKNSGTMLSLHGGIFIKEKYGAQIQVQRDMKTNDNYVGGGFSYKF